jgi:hypothetical protein
MYLPSIISDHILWQSVKMRQQAGMSDTGRRGFCASEAYFAHHAKTVIYHPTATKSP